MLRLPRRTTSNPRPAGWKDFDALKQVEAAGGRTLRPRTEIPGMGAFAYFSDPEGNAVGMWENA